jgi:hypothetical protein
MAPGSRQGFAVYVPALLYGVGLGLFLGSLSAGWIPFAYVNLVAVLLVVGGQFSSRRQGKPVVGTGSAADA